MKRLALCSLLLLLAASLSFAADEKKPDFSGTWVLDTGKSDFGMLPPVESQTTVIEHKEPKIKVSSTVKGQQGEQKVERNYTTDGEENTNKQGPIEVKSKSHWDGAKLITESKFKIQDNDIEMKDTWALSEDGKTYTQNRDLKSPMGETSQKLIFAKQ